MGNLAKWYTVGHIHCRHYIRVRVDFDLVGFALKLDALLSPTTEVHDIFYKEIS